MVIVSICERLSASFIGGIVLCLASLIDKDV